MPDATGAYRVQLSNETHRAIRHMPFIVDHCTKIAQKGVEIGGDGWEVIVQNDPQTKRPRAYIVCRDQRALLRDAKESTLFKIIAALRNYNPAVSDARVPLGRRILGRS
jgi:hypothetical protein